MRRIFLATFAVLLVGCGSGSPTSSTETTQSTLAESTPSTSTEDFCSIVQELDDAADASLAAVFGQGFDATVLTPPQVEDGLDHLREIQGRLSDAAPADAPAAIDSYLDIRSEYMDAVADGGFDPTPDNLDQSDPRVIAWQARSTRALEEELGDYIEATCP